MKIKAEYVWLDGCKPESKLRSKVKVDDYDDYCEYEPIMWAFDGSSTEQASGDKSDCLLKPVRVYENSLDWAQTSFSSVLWRQYLVLCEVLNADGTPHKSNARSRFEDDNDWWFGFEQEYVLENGNGKPLGFPNTGYPKPQGDFYCGSGSANVAGRKVSEEHLEHCLNAGINLTGTNAEVMLGQWEYQCLGKGAKKAADDLWMSRYIMQRLTEKHNVSVNWHPKPISGDWNGSGMHTNFSNKEMREFGRKEIFTDVCLRLEETHNKHILEYGSDNDKRLTGLHETQHIDTFSYGISDRGASIRIPISTVNDGWKGYLEDRRPASNADPYKIVKALTETLN